MEYKLPDLSLFADIGILKGVYTGAIELQKSRMSLKEQIKKSHDYIRTRVFSVWISLTDIGGLREKALQIGETIERYAILSFERYALNHADELYCLDPYREVIYIFTACPSERYIPPDEFWDTESQEMLYVGDYRKKLKSLVDLTVTRVVPLSNIKLSGTTLPSCDCEHYSIPKRRVLRLF